MPVKISKNKNGSYRVSTPGGVKSKHTSKRNAERQRNIINAVEHSDWRPTGKGKGSHREKMKAAVMKKY